MGVQIVSKSADTQRFTSTVSADPDLQVALLAGRTYRIMLTAVMQAGAVADFKFGLSSGGVAISYGSGMWKLRSNEMEEHRSGFDPGSVNVVIGMFTEASLLAGSVFALPGKGDSSTYVNNSCWIWASGLVQPSADCTLSAVWAQNTTSATEPACLLAGSCMVAEEVGASAKTDFVFKTTATTRTTASGALPFEDPELQLTLEPSTTYWISAMVAGWTHRLNASRLRAGLRYSGGLQTTPRVPWYWYARHTQTAVMVGSLQPNDTVNSGPTNFSTVLVQQIFNDTGSDSSAARGGILFEGCLNTDSGTPGVLSLDWHHTDNGGTARSSIVHPGSWLMVEKLNPCTFSFPT